jgi:hypothetical protein
MALIRTYFLGSLAKDEGMRYSFSSRVTACPEIRATSFARHAHNARVLYKTGCKVDVDQASGERATAFLEGRLSRIAS